MNKKGFIQIPLLIAIIISVVAVTTVTTGVVLHKQGKLSPLVASITQVFKGTEGAKPEVKSEEPQLEQKQDVINEEEQESEKESESQKPLEIVTQSDSQVTTESQSTPQPESEPELEPELELEPEVYTEVKGIILSDTTWTLKDSPYIVTGNILVDKGVILTIEPGVKVKVRESRIKWQQYYIEVKGALMAKGTENQKILFTKEKFFEEPEMRRSVENIWEGIQFSGCVDWNESSNTGSIIEYSIIEYASFDKPAIGINSCSPLIKNNIIRHIGWDAIHIGRGAIGIQTAVEEVKPKIINNKIQSGRIIIWEGTAYFSGNEISGNGFYIVGGSPVITKNNIVNNSEDTYGGGIRIDGGSPVITYNNIIGNSANGVSFVGCRKCNPTIEHNNIYNNKVFSVLLTDIKNDFNFPNNWWGTTNASIIDSSIYDFDDDYTLGKVIYEPIATSEIPDAGIQ